MWDDEGNGALFDQSGEFWDQEEYERFVEEYTPLAALGPDDIDDVAHTYNIDSEQIGDATLASGRLRFSSDFEAKISALWHFRGSPGMQTFLSSLDPGVRAAVRKYYRQAGFANGNDHPETCNCPECELLYDYLESTFAGGFPRPGESAAQDYQPESPLRQTAAEPARQAPADAPMGPPPGARRSAPEQMASKPGRMGWFARLMRPWAWRRRR
jgi:hypothetical protein